MIAYRCHPLWIIGDHRVLSGYICQNVPLLRCPSIERSLESPRPLAIEDNRLHTVKGDKSRYIISVHIKSCGIQRDPVVKERKFDASLILQCGLGCSDAVLCVFRIEVCEMAG